MLALHEIIRDIGRSLATLSGDDFAEGLTKALADLLPAFHVGIAEIYDRLGARTSAVIVVATSPLKNSETLADATAVAAHACPALENLCGRSTRLTPIASASMSD